MTVPTTSNYPGALDTTATLFNHYNQIALTLNGAIDSTQTTITVNEDLTGLSPYFFLAFATGEMVYVTAVNVGSYQLTVDRGVLGNNQSHNDDEEMRLTVAAQLFTQVRNAIIAVQTELGTDPAGAAVDVDTRIGDVETLISTHDHDGVESVTINAETVDNFHAYASATANHLLALNADSKLPASITGDADTLDSQHASYFGIKGGLFMTEGSELTISSGSITVSPSAITVYAVDTEADAATDDLTAISGGAEGDVVVLRPANTARTVVIKSGSSNIYTADGNDIPMFDLRHAVMLRRGATNWEVIGGSYPVLREYNITFGANFDVIETGVIGDFVVERDIYLGSWRLYAQQSGSIVVDVWVDTWPTAPDNADTITNANEPTITSSTYNTGSCSSWSTLDIAGGSIIRFNIDSCSTIQQVTLTLLYYSL